METPSFKQLYEEGVAFLKNTPIPSCEKEVRLLLCHSFDIPLSALSSLSASVDPDKVIFFRENLQRRASHEPMAYILGVKEFWSLTFYVNSACLIPRPDSETLIEAALYYYKKHSASLRILDLGTGSGCLLLTLLSELPYATGIGADISEKAIAVAQQNASHLHLEKRACFLVSDWVSGMKGHFDLIISNPPYIENATIPSLQPDVHLHEPHLALSGGNDGLECYKKLLQSLKEHLAPNGHIFLEIGQGQEHALQVLCQENNFMIGSTHKDLQGITRCLVLSLLPKA